MFLPKMFCTYFIHVVPNTDEFQLSVEQKKLYAHADFEKLEGTFIVGVVIL